MAPLPIPTLDCEEIRGIVEPSGGTLRVVVSGSGCVKDLEMVEAFFARVHAAASAEGTTTVVLDLHGLRFLSSALIRALVMWARLAGGANAYSILVDVANGDLAAARTLRSLEAATGGTVRSMRSPVAGAG
jgi:anti-anti-sigma regulatory factor